MTVLTLPAYAEIATPVTFSELKRFVRRLRSMCTLIVTRPAWIIRDGQVHLKDLALMQPPRRALAQWVKAQIDTVAPRFIPTCVRKQQDASIARKGNDDVLAPLAGVVLGRRAHPELYEAFFHVVQAEAFRLTQARLLKEGIPVAGVKTGDRIALRPSDLIDPYTVTTFQGEDVDLSSEAALSRLSRSRSELSKIVEAEEVKSRFEEGMQEAENFGHSEFQVLSDDLLNELMEKEGLFIPRDSDPKTARQLAETILDPKLQFRVLEKLDQGNEVSATSRTYLHRDGSPAFTMNRSLKAGPWQPYIKTPDDVDPDVGVSDSPFAGYSAFTEQATTSAGKTMQLRPVSPQAYDQMLSRLETLNTKAVTIADQLAVTLGDGDLSESAAYDEARNAMMQNQAEINQLERELAGCEVGDVAETNLFKAISVLLGELPKTILLTDAEPKIGEVTVHSPLGRVLLDAQPGMTFQIQAGRALNLLTVQVLSIQA